MANERPLGLRTDDKKFQDNYSKIKWDNNVGSNLTEENKFEYQKKETDFKQCNITNHVYSRSIDQQYPRLCIVCNEPEFIEVKEGDTKFIDGKKYFWTGTGWELSKYERLSFGEDWYKDYLSDNGLLYIIPNYKINRFQQYIDNKELLIQELQEKIKQLEK